MRPLPHGRAVLVVAAVALATARAAAGAPAGAVTSEAYPCQAAVRPGIARLGQPVLYRGRVVVPRGTALRWREPAAGGAFDWGAARSRRIAAFSGSRNRRVDAFLPETVQVEASLQAFVPGILSVPGLEFETREPRGLVRAGRLPTLRLAIVPVVSPADTAATLRPLRGPLAAPWWERVPWTIVGLAALGLLAVVLLWWRWTRRRPRVVAPVAAARAKAPAERAIEALAALRGLHLPEHGRFAEHAFHLTSILRRFLEATLADPRPGDTSPELLRHLEAGRLAAADLERVARLLAAWDRVKFACAASSRDEAHRAEDAVEDLVRRRATARAA